MTTGEQLIVELRAALEQLIGDLQSVTEDYTAAQKQTEQMESALAVERARAEKAEAERDRLKGYHAAGCPVVADDEGDQVLGDYQQCACITSMDGELERKELEARRDQTASIHERNAMALAVNAAQKRIETLEGALGGAMTEFNLRANANKGKAKKATPDAIGIYSGASLAYGFAADYLKTLCTRAVLASPSESAPPKHQGAGAAPPAAQPDVEGLLLDIRERARTSIGDRGYEYIEEAADAALVILKEKQPAAGPPSPALAQPPAPQEGRDSHEECASMIRRLMAYLDSYHPTDIDKSAAIGVTLTNARALLLTLAPPPAEPSAPQAVAARPIEKQDLAAALRDALIRSKADARVAHWCDADGVWHVVKASSENAMDTACGLRGERAVHLVVAGSEAAGFARSSWCCACLTQPIPWRSCSLTVACCLADKHPGYCVATLPIPEGHPLAPAPPAPVSAPQDNENQPSGKGQE